MTDEENIFDIDEGTSLDSEESVEGVSLPGAFAGVVGRPFQTFKRMRASGRSYWWALILVAVLVLIFNTVVQSSFTRDLQAETLQDQFDVDGDGELSADEQQEFDQAMQFAGSPLIIVFAVVTAVIGLGIGYLVRAGILLLMALAIGGKAEFGSIWGMAIWTTLPQIFRNLLAGISSSITGQLTAAGLAATMTLEQTMAQPVLAAFLGMIDIFFFWSLFLVAMGMAATAQVTKRKGALIAVIFGLLTVGATVGFVAGSVAMSNALVGGG